MTEKAAGSQASPHVGLFVTCLVDLFRPSVGFAALKLLQDAGAHVEVPAEQTCCGQPAYNSGDRSDAIDIARHVVETFGHFDYVVVPSGSCAGMIKRHFPELLAGDAAYAPCAKALAAKTYELTSFLVDVLGITGVDARFPATVTYHDSCSSLRELNISDAPRRLLAGVDGLTLKEMDEREVCCGFGGAFAVKYPEISTAMAEAKIRNIAASGATCVLAADLGCLLHLAGRLSRDGSPIACRHVAEVLAGMTETPAIGQPQKPE
jgi:L-lactate dehydrogenase complex protein LldE